METSINTRLGKIEVDSGYPSQESIAKLTDELDYQRACQEGRKDNPRNPFGSVAYRKGLAALGLGRGFTA